MANTIAILTVVDSVGIATTGVNGNVYMIDTEGYQGEQEAGNELITNCKDGDVIQWRITPIRPTVAVDTANYSGQAVSENIIRPQQVTVLGEAYWTSRVELGGNAPGRYQYTFDILINGIHYGFDPYLQISAA